jgi:hypothetical protein
MWVLRVLFEWLKKNVPSPVWGMIVREIIRLIVEWVRETYFS